MACEVGNGVGVFQSRRLIDAEHRLEACSTLRLRLADPDLASVHFGNVLEPGR